MRITIFVFTAMVLTYAILTEGTPIYELVSNAYQVTLAGSFVPLTAGLYWRRATTQGAIFSISMGVSSWAFVTFCDSLPWSGLHGLKDVVPPQLVALGFAIFGMVFGSLAPQWIRNVCHINLNYLGLVPVEVQPTAHSHHHPRESGASAPSQGESPKT
jgi:Na+/proline symporter